MPCAERASSFLITQNSASPCVPNSFNMAKEASANHQKAYMMKELYRRHGFQLTNVHNLLVSQNKLSRLGGHQKPSCHAMVTTSHPRIIQGCSGAQSLHDLGEANETMNTATKCKITDWHYQATNTLYTHTITHPPRHIFSQRNQQETLGKCHQRPSSQSLAGAS